MHDPKKAQELAREIDRLIQAKLGYRASFVLTYSEEDYQHMHWITNVPRQSGIGVVRETLRQMQGEIN